jgi:hypothetical protein
MKHRIRQRVGALRKKEKKLINMTTKHGIQQRVGERWKEERRKEIRWMIFAEIQDEF